jgi:hypothetical protein
MKDKSLVKKFKKINRKEEERRNFIFQNREKHKKCLLQTCKCRKQVMLHIPKLQIQHCFKFELQILLHIMIMGEGSITLQTSTHTRNDVKKWFMREHGISRP